MFLPLPVESNEVYALDPQRVKELVLSNTDVNWVVSVVLHLSHAGGGGVMCGWVVACWGLKPVLWRLLLKPCRNLAGEGRGSGEGAAAVVKHWCQLGGACSSWLW